MPTQHYFFDTSALVKYYHNELGTDQVVKIIDDQYNKIIISQISILEFHSQFAKKARDTKYPKFDANGFVKVCGLLCYHIVSGKFQITELTDDFVFKAVDLIREHSCEKNLRHLDAIQMSSFLDYLRVHLETVFVASDKKLLKVFDSLKLNYYDPES